jgi:hypothetical protein
MSRKIAVLLLSTPAFCAKPAICLKTHHIKNPAGWYLSFTQFGTINVVNQIKKKPGLTPGFRS